MFFIVHFKHFSRIVLQYASDVFFLSEMLKKDVFTESKGQYGWSSEWEREKGQETGEIPMVGSFWTSEITVIVI